MINHTEISEYNKRVAIYILKTMENEKIYENVISILVIFNDIKP